MWAAAGHAVYLAALPETLRTVVAERNARLWKRAGLSAMFVIGCYDAAQRWRLLAEQDRLQLEYETIMGFQRGEAD
eukprot:jgi/Chrzof1/9992/Cz04g23080.t1